MDTTHKNLKHDSLLHNRGYPQSRTTDLIMLPITVNNKSLKHMIKDTKFNLEHKRKKKKERTLIGSRNNCANSYQN